ncbi:MAG: galE [Ilumatobacteraceae bacterium]|nr:galE [Ilumatobacteraceae bacterium]
MIVGGAGFIGSHLVDRLLAEQHAVDVVDDLSSGSLANLASARAAGGTLKIHHLDAGSAEFVALVSMREPEVIVHLGLLAPGRLGSSVMSAAVQTTLNVLDAARRTGPGKVVVGLPATALYGDVPSRDQPIKDGRAFSPTGVRGVISQTVVELLGIARRTDDVEFTALALGSVYGPRQRVDGGVVAAFAHAVAIGQPVTIHGDGRQSRDFVFIDDVVDALVRATQRAGGLVVNVGTGTATPIRDLWAALAGPSAPGPQHVEARPDDVARMALSPTRARIHLAWAPWTDLETGLRAVRRLAADP